ncbi:hypothetical protein TRVA0_003S03422 [Trichomonascus vanleenenianus]|uniref:prefoldin-like protein n=1 Tax=Trichomonascus vanleenenianus TaxID=2268995 RepID=UPI003EC9AAB9
MSFDPLKERIEQSILSLEARLEVLNRGRDQYEEIKKALRNEKLLRKDEQGIPRVTIRVGDGWFIDYTVLDAKRFLEKQLFGAEDELSQLESKLESAHKALNDIGKLELDEQELNNNSLKSASEKEQNVKLADSKKDLQVRDIREEIDEDDLPVRNIREKVDEGDEEKIDGGDLPVMDIREELDEEGNVISSTVEPQQKDGDWQQFAEKHLSRAVAQKENEPKIIYGPELPPGFVRHQKAPKESPKVTAKNNVPKDLHPRIEDVTDAVEKMDISSSAHDNQASIAGKSKVSEIPDEEAPKSAADAGYNIVKSSDATSSSIATEDLLELELIANELDDDEEDYVDDDYQFIENTDDEEDLEDEYGRTRGTMFPFLSKEMLEKQKSWAQMVRNKEEVQDDASDNVEEPVKAKVDSKKVRFAEEVEIKRFDKNNASNDETPVDEPEIDDTAKETPKSKKVSRFKADRMAQKQDRNLVPPVNGDLPVRDTITEHEFVEGPVSENIIERPASEIMERQREAKPVDEVKQPVQDILERLPESPAHDNKERAICDTIVERPFPDIQPVDDVMERIVENIQTGTKPVNDVFERPINDIITERSPQHVDSDKETLVDNIATGEPVNNILQRDTSANGSAVSDIRERQSPVGDIVEKPMPNVVGENSTVAETNPPPRTIKPRKSIKPVVVHRKGSKIPPALARANKSIKPTPIIKHKYDPARVVDVPSEKATDPAEDFPKPHGVSQEIYDRAKEYFKEAILTPEQFLEAFDDGSEEPEQDRKTKIAPPTILSTDIVERPDIQPLEEEDDDYAHDMALMATEYQRIRERLINRSGGFRETDAEKAVEPVDEHGNPIKHSRFKSAQLYKRAGL